MIDSEHDLVRHRLLNQKLTKSDLQKPADIVSWLGAVQAQDYPAAKWGLGLRADDLTDAAIDRAFDNGTILRTHVLRPTWHFVPPADIRWMLALTAPRVNAVSAYYYRKHELDDAVFARSRTTLERALRDGKQLTRAEMQAALARGGIHADKLRFLLLMMRAELDQVICSGPRRGKRFTHALLDERAPRAKLLTREEALAELTRRFFTSHGPATIKDYTWWSGLTVRDAKIGIDLVKPALAKETIGECVYWFAPSRAASGTTAARSTRSTRSTGATRAARPARAVRTASSAHLLPNYDEYLVAYKDRDIVVSTSSAAKAGEAWRGLDPFRHHLVLDGRLAGGWRWIVDKQAVVVKVMPFQELTRANTRAMTAAAERLARFLNRPVELSVTQRAISSSSSSPRSSSSSSSS